MKEVQNKNHTDEAKRLNEELDQNLKDLQPESGRFGYLQWT